MVRAPVPILAQQGDLQVMQRQQVGVADSKRAGQLRLVGEQAGVAAMADVCSAPSAGALNCSAARSPTKSRTACPSPSSAAAQAASAVPNDASRRAAASRTAVRRQVVRRVATQRRVVAVLSRMRPAQVRQAVRVHQGRLDHDRRARLDLLATHPLSLLHPRG